MQSLRIEELSVEQKIGQMLLMRNPISQEDFEFVMELVKNKSLGGIHISHKYVKDDYFVSSEKVFLEKILETADYPILICEDMEYGFPKSEVSLPYQMALGSANSEELCYEYGRITAIEAKRAGYNTVFGPIVDIAMNPNSCCVGSRAFGGTKEIVAKMAAAVIRGYQDQGMIVTAKHFPGFGESAVDNHIGMVYLEGDEQLLIEREIYPYLYAMKNADLSGIMMGHIMVPKVDPVYPASISPKMIDLLRKIGYNDLIMTDSLAMIGMTNMFPLGECHKLAMKAGNDMVMTSYRTGAKEAYGYMLEAYREGMVTEEQITSAVGRVIKAQNRTLKKAEQAEITAREIEATRQMAEKSIAVQLNGVDSPAIDTCKKHLFIIQEGIVYKDPYNGKIKEDSCEVAIAAEVLKEKFPNSVFITIPEFPAKPQLEHVLMQTLQYDSVVMVLANKSVSYTGSSDATKRMVSVMDGLREKLSAVVLFGCPYAAREFGTLKRIIYGFDGKQGQRYAALTLAGEHQAQGKLPVSF